MPLFGLSWLLKRIVWNDPSLRKVNLDGRHIGDDGAKRLAEALRGNTIITVIDLEDNSIGDVGARALADMLKHNSSITALDLNGNGIGDEGARALAEALEVNSSITGLGLSVNGISNVGATALARVLRHNSSVRTLVFGGNSIGDAGARELEEMLQDNSFITVLRLWRNDVGWNGVKDEHYQRMGELTKINKDAPTPEEARRLKLMCKVGWLLESEVDAGAAAAALDGLGSFPKADQRRGLFEKLLGSSERGADVAASVDVATSRILYRYAIDCGATPTVVMNLMRAHPSLCACINIRHRLFPFMLLATITEAEVGDVLELLLLNPNLVESGIGGPVEHLR